jgi:hypothetical protein
MLKDEPAARGSDHVPTDGTASLILDFLEWLGPEPRPYTEVMEAWRTSCPRLSVWEDAVAGGLIVRTRVSKRQAVVEVTPLGRQRLIEAGRPNCHPSSSA